VLWERTVVEQRYTAVLEVLEAGLPVTGCPSAKVLVGEGVGGAGGGARTLMPSRAQRF
jgi:hypothetical protein